VARPKADTGKRKLEGVGLQDALLLSPSIRIYGLLVLTDNLNGRKITTTALVVAWLESNWGKIMPTVSTTFAAGDLVAMNPPPPAPPPPPPPPSPTMTVVTVGGDPLRAALTGLHVECEWFVEGIRHSGWFKAADLHLVK
jgi:hypothetical protein